MKKLSKSKVEDIVWSLWSSYESDQSDDDDLPLPEWGSGSTDFRMSREEREKKEKEIEDEVVKVLSERFPFPEEIVRSVLSSISHVKECVHTDEREVNGYISEWTTKIHSCQGTKGGQREYDLLKKTVEDCVKTYESRWDDRSGEPLVDGRRVNTPEYEKYFNDVVRPLLNEQKKWEDTQKKVLGKIGIPKSECHCLLHFCRSSQVPSPEHQKSREETFERLLRECKHFVK